MCDSTSRRLSTINTILLFVGYILLFVGFFCFAIGLTTYEDELTILGVIVFVSGLLTFLNRIFMSSIISITKSVEYYNAQIEEKFEIK